MSSRPAKLIVLRIVPPKSFAGSDVFAARPSLEQLLAQGLAWQCRVVGCRAMALCGACLHKYGVAMATFEADAGHLLSPAELSLRVAYLLDQ